MGLTPAPYDSGKSERTPGISKSGSGRLRQLLVEMAWMWVWNQPDSKLTEWFVKRWGPDAGCRSRRIGIVALVRQLLVALWRWVEKDVLPEGARLKKAAQTEV